MKDKLKLKPEALWGMSGHVVNTISPHSEADPAALLSQFLAAFGSAIGRGPHIMAEADRHGTNLFILNIGNTSKGRKGTSWGQIEKIFSNAAPDWLKTNTCSGLTSGEGLIWKIKDPEENSFDAIKSSVNLDEDKRLLCFESEFASVLKNSGRKENTLSPILRQAWDSKTLQTLTKNQSAKSTDPHVSVIGHITKQELSVTLNQTEISNGLANRFLFFYIERSKVLPEGGSLTEFELSQISTEVKASIEYSKKIKQFKRNKQARELWREVYPELSEGKFGIVGNLMARSEAQVTRLSLILAALNRLDEINLNCLESAIGIYKYCEDSLYHIFGNSLGNSLADTLFSHLENAPNGIAKTKLIDLTGRNFSKMNMQAALELLRDSNRAVKTQIKQGNHNVEIWKATKFVQKSNELNEPVNDLEVADSFSSYESGLV